jgi:ribosomal protein L37AE/L43A
VGQRKLFYAKTTDEVVLHIDSIDKELNEELFCPFCKEKVIPKQGDMKIWHFAHAGNPCSHSYDKLDSEMKRMMTDNKLVSDFVNTSFSVSKLEVPQDCKEFQCTLCFRIGNKDYGVAWKNNLYLCKTCFADLNGELPEKLLRV